MINPSFVTKKRFDKLLEHFDSGEWEAELGTPLPRYSICPE